MIDFACSRCGMRMNAADDFAGRTVRCRGCGHPVTIQPAPAQVDRTVSPTRGSAQPDIAVPDPDIAAQVVPNSAPFWSGTGWRATPCPTWVVEVPLARFVDAFHDRHRTEGLSKASPLRFHGAVCSNCLGPSDGFYESKVSIRVAPKTFLVSTLRIPECQRCKQAKRPRLFHAGAQWLFVPLSIALSIAAGLLILGWSDDARFLLLAPAMGVAAGGFLFELLREIVALVMARRVPVRPDQTTLGKPVKLLISNLYQEARLVFTNRAYAKWFGHANKLGVRPVGEDIGTPAPADPPGAAADLYPRDTEPAGPTGPSPADTVRNVAIALTIGAAGLCLLVFLLMVRWSELDQVKGFGDLLSLRAGHAPPPVLAVLPIAPRSSGARPLRQVWHGHPGRGIKYGVPELDALSWRRFPLRLDRLARARVCPPRAAGLARPPGPRN